MKCKALILLAIAASAAASPSARADISLGSAGNFAVLGGSTVTNTGPTAIIGGYVGVGPGSSITGFPPGVVLHAGDAVALQAQADLAAAYNTAAALMPTTDLTGVDLGTLILIPGVYRFASSAQLTGTLRLDDQNNPNAQFVFQIGTTLTTATNASVVTIRNGPASGSNVFWQVGSSATIGAGTAFEGNLLAKTSITLNTGASLLAGRALAENGAVTLDTNSITVSPSSVPEPAAMTLVVLGGALLNLSSLVRRRAGRASRAKS